MPAFTADELREPSVKTLIAVTDIEYMRLSSQCPFLECQL